MFTSSHINCVKSCSLLVDRGAYASGTVGVEEERLGQIKVVLGSDTGPLASYFGAVGLGRSKHWTVGLLSWCFGTTEVRRHRAKSYPGTW